MSINKNLFSKKKRNTKKVGLLVVAVLLFLCVCGVVSAMFARPVVTVKIVNDSIYQYEAVPAIAVKATTDKKHQKIVLNQKENYLVKDLLDELNSGKGYKVKHNIDNLSIGTYDVELVLTDDLKEKISYLWLSKVKIKIENGSFEVKESRIDPSKPMIALTFDDGPGKYTDQLLEVLEENGARATFFMLGENVPKYPDAVKRMKELGCEIGNHTTNHKRLTELDSKDIVAQIEGTNTALQDIIEDEASVVRPPYGAVNDTVKENVEYPLIMWSVDTLDWQKKDAKKITDYVMKNVKDGDIVLMHDIHEFSVEAAKTIIPKLVEQGYQLVTVSEMAQIRGIEMINGEKYFSF